jgi:hypothetical protein
MRLSFFYSNNDSFEKTQSDGIVTTLLAVRLVDEPKSSRLGPNCNGKQQYLFLMPMLQGNSFVRIEHNQVSCARNDVRKEAAIVD